MNDGNLQEYIDEESLRNNRITAIENFLCTNITPAIVVIYSIISFSLSAGGWHFVNFLILSFSFLALYFTLFDTPHPLHKFFDKFYNNLEGFFRQNPHILRLSVLYLSTISSIFFHSATALLYKKFIITNLPEFFTGVKKTFFVFVNEPLWLLIPIGIIFLFEVLQRVFVSRENLFRKFNLLVLVIYIISAFVSINRDFILTSRGW